MAGRRGLFFISESHISLSRRVLFREDKYYSLEVVFMDCETIAFLIRAKKKTYAGGGVKAAVSSRPDSHDLIYEENDFKYIDSYLGGRCFSGEEAMWRKNVPFWAMNYSGRVTGDKFEADFLKSALLNVPENMPYRGPRCFKKGLYTYLCEVEGRPEWFHGSEKILYCKTKIYECLFHGGMVE